MTGAPAYGGPPADVTLRPDERVFRAHVAAAPFQSGADRGRWRLVSVTWPAAVIAVAAAPRPGAPAEYAFRFDCTNYPVSPPTACLWEPVRDVPLAFGERPFGVGRVAMAFRTDWQGGAALYLPCDRLSIVGHDAWRALHPEMIWTPASDLTLYLRILHDLLRSRDYTGVRGA